MLYREGGAKCFVYINYNLLKHCFVLISLTDVVDSAADELAE